MKSLLMIAVIVGVAAAASYPPTVVSGVRDAGVDTLTSAYQQAVQEVNAAIEAFKPINATCTEKYELALNNCITCVKDKCTARAQQVCQQKPEDWQIVLGETIGFFGEDIPNFFTNTIPDVFVNKIGGGVIDITKEAGNFFENTIGGGIVHTGTIIGEGVIDAGEDAIDFGIGIGTDIGNGIIDAGNVIGDVAVEGFNTVKEGVNTAIDEIENLGDTIGNTLGGLIRGIGKRSVRMRRQAEPGCSEFQSNSTVACQFYLKPAYCSSCSFSPDTDCPGYTAALNDIQTVNAANIWLSKISNSRYTLEEMTYEFSGYDPATGGFSGVQVKAHVFGLDLTFTVNEAINPFDFATAGPIVAQYALQAFKDA